MLFRPKIQYPTPETINRKCTGRKILSTVLHDVLCIRISVQMHIMHKIKAGLALFNTIKGLRVLCISSMDSGKPFFWNKRKSSFDAHFVTFDRHTKKISLLCKAQFTQHTCSTTNQCSYSIIIIFVNYVTAFSSFCY